MTQNQIIEFAKLQIAYLEKVMADDASEQLQMMELVFFWIENQIVLAILQAVKSLSHRDVEFKHLSDQQKKEFSMLQLAMLSNVLLRDRAGMATTEKDMWSWIDHQISIAESEALKGRGIRMIVAPGNKGKNKKTSHE